MHKRIKILFSTLGSLILLLAVFLIPYDVWAVVGTWSDTGSLNVARWAFTMTLLPDGKVLAVGGCTGAYCYTREAGFEIYDPTLGTWSHGVLFVDGQYIAPVAHTATLMQDGKVLVVVGDCAGTSILYDPITAEWHATGSSSIHRSCSGSGWRMPYHTATLLQDGRVLVTGGYSSTLTLNSAEIYNPVGGTWDSVNNMQSGRARHTATLLPNGKVLIAGGTGGDGAYSLNSAEIYDPFTNTWALTGQLHYARSSHTATLLKNGKVLVTGGTSSYVASELYDPATGTWTDTGIMAYSHDRHIATLLPDGKVFVAGGSGTNGVAGNWVEIYDPALGTWSQISGMKSARTQHADVLLQDAKVLVAGGVMGNPCCVYLTSAEIYDTGIQIWHKVYLPLVVR
jgi:hypothetical protein